MVRGVNYDGLGTHPWVARVGFTSKQLPICYAIIVKMYIQMTYTFTLFKDWKYDFFFNSRIHKKNV